uniref:C3H1-type domain-containing protein n=1 Tax=Araucaria cunninghamii TaxID=56994 RepID=A0A0D6R4Y8_ARACU
MPLKTTTTTGRPAHRTMPPPPGPRITIMTTTMIPVSHGRPITDTTNISFAPMVERLRSRKPKALIIITIRSSRPTTLLSPWWGMGTRRILGVPREQRRRWSMGRARARAPRLRRSPPPPQAAERSIVPPLGGCSSRRSCAASFARARVPTSTTATSPTAWRSSANPRPIGRRSWPSRRRTAGLTAAATATSFRLMAVEVEVDPPPVVVAGGNGGGNGGEARFHKSRFCKKYYTEEGCPYGDRCNFLHDDQGRSRESVAISLGPTTSNGSGGGNEIASAAANGGGGANGNSNGNNNGNNNSGNGAFQRPMYWKTRICNKWETTGHCPFGDKCHFAHGVAELQKYGGGLLESESGATSGGLRNDLKQSASSGKLQTDPGIGTSYSVFGTDNYSMGVPNQRSLNNFQGQRQGQRPLAKWKGPDKISQIYGDWIDESEWEYANLLTVPQPEEVNQIHEEESHDG